MQLIFNLTFSPQTVGIVSAGPPQPQDFYFIFEGLIELFIHR
jgi:hypothetical protein